MVVVKEGRWKRRGKALKLDSTEKINKTRERDGITQRQKYRLTLSKGYFDLDELQERLL